MSTENTSLKNTTPTGDSNTTNEMVMGKINNYQRTFLIVAGSLLALLVLIAVAGTSGIQHLQSSVYEITKGAVALQDYQDDSANLAFTMDIFGDTTSENDGGCSNDQEKEHCCYKHNSAKSSKCDIGYPRGMDCTSKLTKWVHCCPNGGVEPCHGAVSENDEGRLCECHGGNCYGTGCGDNW